MKITSNQTSLNNLKVYKAQKAEADKTKNGLKSTSSGHMDRVEISQVGQLAAQVAEATMNDPEIDMERVEKLRAMIENGDYEIDARALADRILSDHLSL